MPPLLLSSPRSGRLRRASVPPLLPLTAAVLLCLVPASSSFPAHNRCPQDCAKLRRQNCPLGSSFCGPCYRLFEEDEQGRCVLMSRHQHGKVVYTDLDEEIDFLHSVIEKKEKSITNGLKKESKHPAVLNLQAGVGSRRTDDSKPSQRTQNGVSNGPLRSTTAAPQPAASSLPSTPTPQPRATGRIGPIAVPAPSNDNIIVIIISLCVVVGSVAVIMATICVVKMQKHSRLAEKVDYPAFKGTDAPAPAANGTSMGDTTLAQSAQMYHYQHQKQQMISMGNSKPEAKVPDTDVTSDEEEVGGDFTVYECPGLAPTGEMEVKNPLFDDSTIQYQGNHK